MGCRDILGLDPGTGNDSLGEVVTSYDRRSGRDVGLFVVIDCCDYVGRFLLRSLTGMLMAAKYPRRLAASPMARGISRSMKTIMPPFTQRAASGLWASI